MKPIADPPLWARSLPTVQASASLAATDPACATELGRNANGVVWRDGTGQLQSRMFSQPVNFKAADGTWHPIDTRLVDDGHGGYTNKSGPFNAHFASDGTAAGLVQLNDGTASLSMGFDGTAQTSSTAPLAPSASTAVAANDVSDAITYPSVMAGTDLQYQVLGQAVKEAIVLHSPLASGVSPSFRFSAAMRGVVAQTAQDGTVQFVDPTTWQTRFALPAGVATDAAGATTSVTVALSPTTDPSHAELVESIDPVWLADPGRVFPVTIDPTTTIPALGDEDTYVANSSGDQNLNFSGLNGYDTTLLDYVENAGVKSSETFRGLATFYTAPVAGTLIQSATWHGYADAVSGTTPVTLTLKVPSAAFDPNAVTWNTQPAVRTGTGTTATTGGYSGAGWQTADITTFMTNWAGGTWANDGLEITGPSTGRVQLSASLGAHAPYIDVTYDPYPTMSNYAGGGQFSTNYTNAPQPTLSTVISDVDNPPGLQGNFEIWDSAKTTRLGFGSAGAATSGQAASWHYSGTPTSLPDGTYWWRVDATDGVATTGWSVWQQLIVDTAAPATPTITVGGVTVNTWKTAGGTSATGTLSDTSTPLAGYEWGLDLPANTVPTTFVKWNSSGTTITLNPTWGWHDLAVRAIDAAGNVSTSVQHFTFGWGQGGFSAPQVSGLTTQAKTTVTAASTTSYAGLVLQWRRADADGWTNITLSDLSGCSGGCSAWPITAPPGSHETSFPPLVWNVAATANRAGFTDGTLQLRAGFNDGTPGGAYTYLTDTPSIPHLTLNQTPFGGGYASTSAGPGTVNLLTGNLSLSATDVSVPGGSLARTFQSRAATGTGGIFGPGWTTTANGYQYLDNETDTVIVHSADGTETDFSMNSDGSYTSPAGSSDLTLTKKSSTRFELKRLSFVTYGFTSTSGNFYYPSDVTDATGQTSTTTWAVNGAITEPTQETAPPPPTINCTTAPLTTRGCQTLTFDYASTTQTTVLCGSPLGDYAGQVRNVYYTAWDPDKSGGAAMNTVNVATYCYDSSGMLRAEWDPRISPVLETQYTYNTNGQVDTLTPPGTNAWHFTYAPLTGEPASTGRLSTVYRAEISPLGNATTTFVYQIPLTTTGGPYNMDASTVATWGQQDLPTDATAVFPPDQIPSGSPPSDYTRATISYMDVNGRQVNVAQPGGDISTTEYDNVGHVVRTLSPANRQEALAFSTNALWEALEASLLGSQATYAPITSTSSVIDLVDSVGPAHMVTLPDGTSRLARQHQVRTYDSGAPGGGTYELVTAQTESAKPVDGSSDQDVRETDYAYTNGSDNSGWTLGTPLQTIIDPGTGHLHLTTTMKYDVTTGQQTARILPASTGGDAHETDFVYYTAGTNSVDASCGNHPEWVTLLCDTTHAAQPGTTGLPNIATSQVTGYNMYGSAETTVDTNGSDNRTTTAGYDAAGRQTAQHVTGTSGAGTALPTITTVYDTATGQPYTTTDGTSTITRTYDALGRPSSYQDADGNTSTYTYDLLGRPSTRNDGKGTATITYDDVGTEERGLPTTINYGSGIGSFTATYDANGNLATQTSPGSFAATYTRDETGELTKLWYNKSGSIDGSTATYNIHGEQLLSTVSLEAFQNTYDAAGRLTQAADATLPFGYAEYRTYQFDADTNRTQLQHATGPPGNQTTTTTTSTYDAADRATTSGYAYDNFGRTTTVPAAATSTGYNQMLSYYANDLVNTITNNGTTVTQTLDPNERFRTFVNSSQPTVTHTNHYAGDGDSPAWTSEVTDGSSWTRFLSGFGGMAASTDQAGVVTDQLADIHGDVFLTLASTAANTNDSSTRYSLTTEYGLSLGGSFYGNVSRYDYLGTHQRSRDLNSGLILMGERVYNPTTGRFLQTDPVLGGSANNYDYANGDPVNGSDLTGQSSCHSCDVWIWMAAVHRNQVAQWEAAVHRNNVATWMAAVQRTNVAKWMAAEQGNQSDRWRGEDPGSRYGHGGGTYWYQASAPACAPSNAGHGGGACAGTGGGGISWGSIARVLCAANPFSVSPGSIEIDAGGAGVAAGTMATASAGGAWAGIPMILWGGGVEADGFRRNWNDC